MSRVPTIRRGLLAASLVLAGSASAQAAPPTAAQVIDRIKQQVGVSWSENTVDTFKAGDPGTPVTGIAVTMMATLDVLQRAAAAGANLVITHEPTFFDHLDATGVLEQEHDAVLAAKQAFIRDHRLVVWRFHDHWHRRAPDGVQTGMTRALGWERYQTPGDASHFVLPAMSVEALASLVSARLGVSALRIVGDPRMVVTKVALLPGAPSFEAHRHALQREDVEVLVMGEAREWETIEYAADAIAAGLRKALVIPGHIPSEQAGMEECVGWLKAFVPEVAVTLVPTAEPFRLVR